MRALIVSHLEDIRHNRLPVIQKRTGFGLETIQVTRRGDLAAALAPLL